MEITVDLKKGNIWTVITVLNDSAFVNMIFDVVSVVHSSSIKMLSIYMTAYLWDSQLHDFNHLQEITENWQQSLEVTIIAWRLPVHQAYNKMGGTLKWLLIISPVWRPKLDEYLHSALEGEFLTYCLVHIPIPKKFTGILLSKQCEIQICFW